MLLLQQSLCFFAVSFCTALALPTLLNVRSNPAYPDPNDDPFYRAPSNLSTYGAGQVIRSRLVPSNIAITAHQVLFRTKSNANDIVATVATIWSPLVPSKPPKVFAYQFAEDADNLDCDPSWAFVFASGSNANYLERLIQGPFLVSWALTNGYYVVSTDAEGPTSDFPVGRTEGPEVLDALRTSIAFLKLALSTTKIAMYGYSGAAHMTVWAATFAAAYAPELPIVGAAFGGTPIDPRANIELDNNTTQSLLVGASLFGYGNGYPSFNTTLNGELTPQGQAIGQGLRARNNCSTPANPLHSSIVEYNTVVKTGSVYALPGFNDILARESLLSNVSTTAVPVPKFPRLEYHGTGDTTVPYWPEAVYVTQQCNAGANIRFVPFSGHDHAATAILGLPGALLFVKQALDESLAAVKCGQAVAMPSLKSKVAMDLLGADTVAKLEKALVKSG